MSDKKALLDAIWEHPHDDTVRLAYADWLDERGESARAELIRTQIESARLNEWDDGHAALVRRERELLAAHRDEWRAKVPKRWARSTFHRGFLRLELSDLKFEKLIQLTVRQLKLAPLARYHYYLPGRHYDKFLAWPGAVFQDLFAPRPPLPDGWLDRLVECERLRNVSEVAFICEQRAVLGAAEVQAILDTWVNRPLTAFWLTQGVRDENERGADDTIFEVLAGHSALEKTRRLNLRGARPTAAGFRALWHAPRLRNVRAVDLWGSTAGDAGLIELARSPLLSSLRELDLNTARVGDAGVAALANAPAAAHLRKLHLYKNDIGPDGFRALAQSPHLGGLLALDVPENPGCGDDEAKAELRARFGHLVRFRV